MLGKQVQQLLSEQLQNWPLAKKNYEALSGVEARSLDINGHTFLVQFNPGRIISSTAKVDAKSIQERKCFLCRHHLPPEQRGIPYTAKSGHEYIVLCNPFPIFPRHLTIPDIQHTEQLISGRVKDMLELAALLPEYVLFYNGPKCGASAPDHFHFQAGNKDFLPLPQYIEQGGSLKDYPLAHYILESEDSTTIPFLFTGLMEQIRQRQAGQDAEPMMNLLCWKAGAKYYLVIFPRKAHRPTQFFAEGEANILLSPATIDLAGVLITPQEKDFRKLNAADVKDIFKQISL